MTEPDRTAVLEWIDEALAKDQVVAGDPRGRELQELALALRDESPEPDPAFAAALDRRVAAGFPRERRLPRPLSALGAGRRSPMLAFGAAASVLIAVVVAASLLRGADETDPTSVDAVSPMIEEGAPPPAAERSAGAADAVTALPGREPLEPDSPRRIERSAQLTLSAPDDELERVGTEIVGVADRHRGFVERSTVSTGDAGDPGGTFELRIPARRLEAALRDLSALADVRARTQSGDDVTGTYVSQRDRIIALRAERRSLLRRLAGADTDDEAERIRRRLDAVAAELNGLRSQFRALRERTAYGSVEVRLVASEAGSGAAGDLGDAFDDALGALAATLGIALRVLGVALPLALVCGAAWLGARTLRRRRREAVLS